MKSSKNFLFLFLAINLSLILACPPKQFGVLSPAINTIKHISSSTTTGPITTSGTSTTTTGTTTISTRLESNSSTQIYSSFLRLSYFICLSYIFNKFGLI